MRPGLRPAGSWVRRAAGVGTLLIGAALGGCLNPLYPENEDRSQYAAFDRARDQTVPAYIEDEFGRRRPNLRGRLLSRD